MSQEVEHLLGKDEGLDIPHDEEELLEMPKEVPEIDMEEPPRVLLDHVVPCVSVSDAEYEGGCTLACTGFDEVLVVLLPVHGHYLGFKFVFPKRLDILKN